MFRYKYALFGAGCLLAATVACSNTGNPVSPNAALPGSGAAGPNGETLKIDAPATTSPAGGATATFPLTLTVGNVTGRYATFPVTYRYEIRNAAGTTVATGTQAAGSGATTSIVVSGAVDFDAPLTWRVRAENGGAVGPWSAAASFRSPAGSFFRGNEILDLLTDGTTVGRTTGSVTFIPGVGARLNNTTSYIFYQLPTALVEGEFSMIATNVDEGNVADKSKVMVMAEGCHVDVTDNDYRQTLEVRGNQYLPSPGQISYRIITGIPANHRDTPRIPMTWDRSRSYFFKMAWRTGSGSYEVREDGPTGRVVASGSIGTDGRAYRPDPHCVYIGSGPARGGAQDSTHPGMTARYVWLSGSPRPTFPSIVARPE